MLFRTGMKKLIRGQIFVCHSKSKQESILYGDKVNGPDTSCPGALFWLPERVHADVGIDWLGTASFHALSSSLFTSHSSFSPIYDDVIKWKHCLKKNKKILEDIP